MKTRFLALFLALAMVIGIMPAAIADEEPMHITVAGYLYGPVNSETDVTTPAVEKLLREKHGINVDIEIVYVEQSEYAEIINTRLAGGTAPDVFLAQSATTLQNYYDQGVIKEWDESFFAENAPDVYKFITEGAVNGDLIDSVEDWRVASRIDGKMVTIPSFKPDGSMPYKTLIYRGDWIDKLGYTEETLPKTVDEFVELMTKFAKEDPDGNGIDDTYGMSITGMKALFGAYGLSTGFTGSSSYWVERDGKLINSDVAPEAKTVVALLADMYANGLIDPEFVTGKESVQGSYWAVSHGMVTGLYGASANASIDHYRLKGVVNEEDAGGPCATEYWAVNGEDSKFVYAPWPAGPNGDYGWAVGSPVAVSESAVYNADISDEKLATIFQIMNAFATDDELFITASFGVEGQQYTVAEDGKLVRTVGMGNEDLNAVGVWGCRSLYGGDRAFSETSYNLAFYNDKSIANRLEYFKKDQFNSYIQNKVTVTLPSEGDLNGELATLRDEAWVNIITGKASIDTWDDYVARYMAAGGQTLEDEANAWYATTK